jgi:hypothetical protein
VGTWIVRLGVARRYVGTDSSPRCRIKRMCTARCVRQAGWPSLQPHYRESSRTAGIKARTPPATD